ncbi:MAG: hypothetical protein WC758_03155 [Candidatus Woesearchaeota archaeon]|jgi:hypothetical protein
MKQKRGLLSKLTFSILFIAIFTTISVLESNEVYSETYNNCIPCESKGCVVPNPDSLIAYDYECIIKKNVNDPMIFVDVVDSDITGPHVWNFKKLTVQEGMTLWFMNSEEVIISNPSSIQGENGCICGDGGCEAVGFPPVDGEDCLNGCTEDRECLGGNSAQSPPPVNYFGDGGAGDGGRGEDGNQRGGSGGGGGAGGLMFQRGTYGGRGGDGRWAGPGYPGHAGGPGAISNNSAGAYVKLILNELSLIGNISVSGFDGDDAINLSSSNRNGGGGGGGAGGSGAGKIELYVANLISTTGYVLAKGGDGGEGGKGEDEDGNNNDDGCFGGGGGGGHGGIIISQIQEGVSLLVDNSVGKGGLKGAQGECNSGYGAEFDGKDGLVGITGAVTEIAPSLEDSTIYLANCNDGEDNEGDTKKDMDEPECRYDSDVIDIPWDASIWENYVPKPSSYNASAKNGTDFACGDDVGGYCSGTPGFCDYDPFDDDDFDCEKQMSYDDCFSHNCWWLSLPASTRECSSYFTKDECNDYSYCSWSNFATGQSDLGAITSDNSYLCLDYVKGEGESQRILAPGNNYAWFEADGVVLENLEFNEFTIFHADETQFISNSADWFWCNAAGNYNYGSKAISEYGTFNLETNNGEISCSVTLEKLLRNSFEDEDKYVQDCLEGTEAGCKNNCIDDDNCEGVCYKMQGSLIRATYSPGSFVETCEDACDVKNGAENAGEFTTSVAQYITSILSTYCSMYPYEPDCIGFVPGLNWDGNSGESFQDQEFCDQYPTECLGSGINSGLTCEQVYDALNLPYTGDDEKICGAQEFCANGDLYPSNGVGLNIDKCCVGREAYCQAVDGVDITCSDVGGVERGICTDCVCMGGVQVATDCCLNGNWVDMADAYSNVNESFICYKEEDKSLIKECCGTNECFNGGENNNVLYADYSLSYVFGTNGVPIHSIVSFDDIGNLKRLVKVFTKLSTVPKDITGFGPSNYLNWSNFDYLEFDILYSAKESYDLILTDAVHPDYGTSKKCTYNINNNIAVKKGLNRWQHVTIDIGAIEQYPINCEEGFNKAKIVNMQVRSSSVEGIGVNVAFDNFFLSEKQINNVNSQNRFCSGKWGDWVSNLDGPIDSPNGDTGFVSLNGEVSVSDLGPYRDACEGIISFGWTGNVCCGDDTAINNHGEFWKDTEGACWKGTAVFNDKTVADALGLSPIYDSTIWNSNQGNNTKSLLYYEGDLWSCDRELNNYSEKISYDGVPSNNALLRNSINPEVQTPFSIKGSWMCMPDEGWVKLTQVNRIRPLIAVLKALAVDNGGDYTLMCGEYANMSNYLPLNLKSADPSLTSYACVLRMGDNSIIENDIGDYSDEQIILGLEVANVTIPFNDYKDQVLNEFQTLIIVEEDTCESLSTDMSSDEFFEKCAESVNSEFSVYYNKPLNLMLVSQGNIEGSVGIVNSGFVSFVKNMWTSVKNFFASLFGAPVKYMALYGYDEGGDPRDFYISVQGNKEIKGIVEYEVNTNIRVDYTNLSTSVELFSKVIKSNYPNVDVTYFAHGYNQTIYVTLGQAEDVDWKLMTSLLRINGNNEAPKYFELTNSFCVDTDGTDGSAIFTKGTVYVGYDMIVDSCLNSTHVNEVICSNNESQIISLPCYARQICQDGACVGDGNCYDSDGEDAYIKGETSKGTDFGYDSCSTDLVVSEAICINNNIDNVLLNCNMDESCQDGVCVRVD